MAKVIRNAKDRYRFECPGCETNHVVNDSWQFNGDFDRPTFSPSILVSHGEMTGVSEETKRQYKLVERCHSFVRDGRIQFLDDCTHKLAGQTVELPEIQNGDSDV